MNTASIIIWLIISITFLLIDVFTSSFLFVWFGVGGLFAMIFAILGFPMEMQIIVFLIISLISIAIGYPWAKKRFKVNQRTTKTREEELTGTILKAETDIIDTTNIKLDGVLWRAYNKGEMINKGEKFRVIEFKGNQVIIEKVRGELK